MVKMIHGDLLTQSMGQFPANIILTQTTSNFFWTQNVLSYFVIFFSFCPIFADILLHITLLFKRTVR